MLVRWSVSLRAGGGQPPVHLPDHFPTGYSFTWSTSFRDEEQADVNSLSLAAFCSSDFLFIHFKQTQTHREKPQRTVITTQYNTTLKTRQELKEANGFSFSFFMTLSQEIKDELANFLASYLANISSMWFTCVLRKPGSAASRRLDAAKQSVCKLVVFPCAATSDYSLAGFEDRDVKT